jgi:hypothetical protein
MKMSFISEDTKKTEGGKDFFFAPSRLRGISICASTILVVAMMVLSCRKDHSTSIITYPQSRTIRFQLYTNNDFSTNTSTINFSIFIRNGSKTLFDSSLASIQIKDIPDSTHKIVIEKTVADNSDLGAGFRYEIPNVGISWHIDTSKAGNSLKVIDYAFQ